MSTNTVLDRFRLDGKVAIVTGASSGLGVAFGKALEQQTQLREALTDATLPVENKKAVVEELIGERANPVTLSLLGFVIDAGRAREIRLGGHERDYVVLTWAASCSVGKCVYW